MKTTTHLFLLVFTVFTLVSARAHAQVRYTFLELTGKSMVTNAVISASPEYGALLDSVAKSKVSERLTPVHLYSSSGNRPGIEWLGTGTAYVQNSRDYIVTAGHIFANSRGTNLYFYRKVQETNWHLYGIEQVFSSHELLRDKTLRNKSELDVAVAVQGRALPISPFSELTKQKAMVASFAYLGDTNLVLTSLVNGKVYGALAVGMEGLPTNFTYKFLIFDYQSVSGESGTGFLGSDGHLYVLMGSMSPDAGLSESLKKAGIKYRHGLARSMMVNLGLGK
jgi:hypothetical protein